MRLAVWAAAVALGVAPAAAAAQEVAKFKTIEKAVEAAQKDGKDIIVDFTGSDW